MASEEDDYEWWKNALIPLIAAFVGYGTNILALHMTFYPIEYTGIKLYRFKDQPFGLFGWQGIIPTRTEKIANKTFDLMTTRLLDFKEIFSRIDPIQFAKVMEDPILLLIDETINEVANEYMPNVWNKLPKDVRDDIVVSNLAGDECTAFVAGFLKDLQENVDDIIDLKSYCVRKCVENKEIMLKIFHGCGDQELEFIRRSGFYFGFLFGLIQLAIWLLYPARWMYPLAGFMVGYFTNYIALKVIFRPVNPIPLFFGLYTLHGLFLKRQKQVSEVFSRIICNDIVHVRAMFDEIFDGPLRGNFYAILRAHTLLFTDKLLVEIRPIAVASLGADQYAKMKEAVATKVLEGLRKIIDRSYEYVNEALGHEDTMREKMELLSYEEFEGVLHPAFEEDEIILVILGGVLGGAVGVIQLFTLFQN